LTNPDYDAAVKPDPELEALRQTIDEIDGRILELLAARVKVVLAVGDYKRQRGLPVYDPERERGLLDRLCSAAQPPLDRETVRRIFERLVDESRRIEQHHVGTRDSGRG
jgi:chorismate mutase